MRNQQYEQVKNTELIENFPIDWFTRYITYPDQYDAVTEFLAAAAIAQ